MKTTEEREQKNGHDNPATSTQRTAKIQAQKPENQTNKNDRRTGTKNENGNTPPADVAKQRKNYQRKTKKRRKKLYKCLKII